MKEYITLAPSPVNPGIEIVAGLTIARLAPYNNYMVTLQFTPNILEHEPENDHPGLLVRQITMTVDNNETVKHQFDLNGTRKHVVQTNGTSYEVELLNITIGGEFNLPMYKLAVTKSPM